MSLLFQELVRRGIPHHFRGIAWQLLCNAHESKDKPKYAEYIRTQSACEKVKHRRQGLNTGPRKNLNDGRLLVPC